MSERLVAVFDLRVPRGYGWLIQRRRDTDDHACFEVEGGRVGRVGGGMRRRHIGRRAGPRLEVARR